jgi:hypothetical protein
MFLAWMALGAQPARADSDADRTAEFDTKQIFGFTQGTDINAPGEREAEFVTTARWRKRGGGRYRALEQEATDEGALTSWFGYELTLHGAAVLTRDVPGLESLSRAGFSGLSAEPKFVLLPRGAAAPVGLALSFQPEWERIDAVSGEDAQSFSLPVRLMADAAFGEKFYAAANLLYAPERDRQGRAAPTLISLLGATGALTWRMTPHVSLGAELEAYSAANSLGLGGATGTAVYFGPTFFARLSPTLFVAGAWSAQIAGHAVATRLGDANQTEFSRRKAELTLGIAF